MTGGELFDFSPLSAPVSAAERSALMANPVFGRVFTDHMVTIRYADGKGWYDARVEAARTDPDGPGDGRAALRAGDLRGSQGVPHGPTAVSRLFRPDANAQRFRDSAARMAMAQLPEELFLGSLARAGQHRPGVGADRPRGLASTCGRSCSPARCSSA